jgi:hypothetical protein
MIVNHYKAKKQLKPDIKYKELMASISTDSGIGMRTVITTISEYKNTGESKSPRKTKIRPTFNDKIENFDKNAIRQKIHGFWSRAGEMDLCFVYKHIILFQILTRQIIS